jgi:predicted RNase H-like HicB family nuclease
VTSKLIGRTTFYAQSNFSYPSKAIKNGTIAGQSMRQYTAIIEFCSDTGLYVGYVPGFPGAHSQGETLDELSQNLTEVISMLLEDGEPQLETQFVGTQSVHVP